ncbi:hypothetical protein VUR80DRAFT_4541 [Thermomyces stellatus]
MKRGREQQYKRKDTTGSAPRFRPRLGGSPLAEELQPPHRFQTFPSPSHTHNPSFMTPPNSHPPGAPKDINDRSDPSAYQMKPDSSSPYQNTRTPSRKHTNKSMITSLLQSEAPIKRRPKTWREEKSQSICPTGKSEAEVQRTGPGKYRSSGTSSEAPIVFVAYQEIEEKKAWRVARTNSRVRGRCKKLVASH